MSPELYQLVPVEARDQLQPYYVRWGFVEPGADPFLSGALWAGYASLGALVGSLLGALAEDALLLQRWDPTLYRYVDVA